MGSLFWVMSSPEKMARKNEGFFRRLVKFCLVLLNIYIYIGVYLCMMVSVGC